MKRITLFAAILVASVSAKAQDFYTFTKSEATYQELTDAVSMNDGEAWWFLSEMGPFEATFPVSVFGQEFNKFAFIDGNFITFNDDDPIITFFYPTIAFLMDKGYPDSSQSPVSYKIEGNEGSRTLKLEVKNAGLETEFDTENDVLPTSTYLNYQIWFFEEDDSIEYHYGDHNITDLFVLNGDGFSAVAIDFYNDSTMEEAIGFVTNEISNPIYLEFTEESEYPDNPEELLTLDDVPQPNTVYRFALNPASVNGMAKTSFSLYPNPVTNQLNLTFNESIYTSYTIYDLTGRSVLSGTVNGENNMQIYVGSMQNGTYLLTIGNTTKKFIKK